MKNAFLLSIILTISFLFRIKLLEIYPLDADQAIFGLMALHILKGIDFPIFIYGCHYGGSLTSIISAGFIKLFGLSLFSLEIGTIIESLLFILITYFVGKQFFNQTVGFLAALLVAIPPPLLGHFSVKITGGYLLLTNVGGILLIYLHKLLASQHIKSISDTTHSSDLPGHYKTKDLPAHTFAILGFISGIAFWQHIPIIIYILTFFMFIFIKKIISLRSTAFKLFSICFIAGTSPIVIYNILHPGASVLRFATLGMVGFSREKAESIGFLKTLLLLLKSKFMFFIHSPILSGKLIVGLFTSENMVWEQNILILITELSVGILFLVAILNMLLKSYKNFKLQKYKDRAAYIKNYQFISEDIIIAFNLFTFLFLAITGGHNPRHIFYLYSTIFITIAKFLYDIFWASANFEQQTLSADYTAAVAEQGVCCPVPVLQKNRVFARPFNFIKPAMLFFLLCFILAVNLQGNFEAKSDRRNYNFEKLLRFLEKNKITRGFSGYEISYSVVFLSNEKIILSPSAGPDNIDRYPQFTDIVRKTDNPAYIFRADSLSDKKFEVELNRLKIERKKDRVENFVVYYHLTKKILPEAVNIPRIF